MMPVRFLLANASLLLLASAGVPAANAGDVAVDPGVLDPDVAISLCSETYRSSWDSDQDGHAEEWTFCTTPQCGCNCPVVGALVQVATPDEQRNVLVAASCQSGFGTSKEAGDGSAGVKVTPVLYGGGLDPILDSIGTAIALP